MTSALATAWPPLILLAGAAAFESLRPVVLVLLGVAFPVTLILARRRDTDPSLREVMVYAACLVVAVDLAWGGLPLPSVGDVPVACADRMAPFALVRVAGAVVVLGSLALVLRLARVPPAELGLRWPSRGWLALSCIGLAIIAVLAIVIGPRLAEPFFGPISSPSADLRGILPALAFAIANATMEEAAYRGALLRWLAPVTGMAAALALQAIVFGLAHGVGTDFIGSPLPVMAATAAAGLILGGLALRSRSLFVPIAMHVALDIPVFFGKVCLGT